MILPWWAVSILTSAVLIGTEYINRSSDLGLWLTMLRIWPLVILGQVGLYYLFNSAPSWLLAWGFFCVTNTVFRVGASYYSGEPFTWGIFFGVSLMIAGVFLIRTG